MEDVGDAQGEAEDYAEHAGPGAVLAFARGGIRVEAVARTIGRRYLLRERERLAAVAQELNGFSKKCDVSLLSAYVVFLLKFRDLNSSARVILEELEEVV